MTIIDKIKQSVEQATGLPFYYDTPQTLNVRLDNLQLPCAMMNVVESGATADENGVMREQVTAMVLFTDTTTLDFDGIDNEREHLDAMKKAAFRWLLSLRRSDTLRLMSTGGTARFYATEDAIVTAFGVTVTLEELEGVCYGGLEAGYSEGACPCAG